MAPQAKKNRVRCKNAGLHHTITQQTLFCGAKKENGAAGRGPNAVLKKIKNGNFKVTSRFWGGKKKNFPPSEAVGNNKSEV